MGQVHPFFKVMLNGQRDPDIQVSWRFIELYRINVSFSLKHGWALTITSSSVFLDDTLSVQPSRQMSLLAGSIQSCPLQMVSYCEYHGHMIGIPIIPSKDWTPIGQRIDGKVCRKPGFVSQKHKGLPVMFLSIPGIFRFFELKTKTIPGSMNLYNVVSQLVGQPGS